MKAFFAVLVVFVLLAGITAYARGWFKFSKAPTDEGSDITLSVDTDKMKKDKDDLLAKLKQNTSPSGTNAVPTDKERDELAAKTEIQLKEMDKQLAAVKAKVQSSGTNGKKELEAEIANLETKTAAARKDLVELKSTTGDRLNGVMSRLTTVMKDLKEMFDVAAKRFE